MTDKPIIVTPTPGAGGEIKISRGGIIEELKKPFQQWLFLLALRVLLVVAIGFLVLVWAPMPFYLACLAPLGLALWQAWGDSDNLMVRYGLPAIGLGLTICLFYWWDSIMAALWPPTMEVGHMAVPLRITWQLHIAVRLVLSIIPSVYLWSYQTLAYKLGYEIVDDSWPPTVVPRRPEDGPALPGRKLRAADATDEPQVVERVVSRPVPVHTTNAKQALAEIGGDGRLAQFQQQAQGRTLMSPNHVEVRLADLLTYIRHAPLTGASYSNWKRWKHEYWHAVVMLLTLYGIVTEPQERMKTRFLVSQQEALALLTANLDHPTLWESVSSSEMGGETDKTETEQAEQIN